MTTLLNKYTVIANSTSGSRWQAVALSSTECGLPQSAAWQSSGAGAAGTCAGSGGGRLHAGLHAGLHAAGAFIMRRAPSSCGGRFHAGLHAGCAQLPHSSCRLQADQPLLLCSKMPARLRLLSPRARASFSLPYLLPLAAARSCGRSPAPPDRAPQAPWCGRPPHAAFRCGTADGGGGVFSSARGL